MDAGAHCIAITFRADQSKVEEMVCRCLHRCAAATGGPHCCPTSTSMKTIVVEVCETLRLAPTKRRLESTTGDLCGFPPKLAVPFIVEQRVDLLEVHVRRGPARLRDRHGRWQ